MSFIGIDLGTTFIKGAVLDVKARKLEHTQRILFPDRLKANPLLWEFDPDEIVALVRKLISGLLVYAPDCEGIAVCSQMHGVVLTSNAGDAVSNCVSWRDERVLMPYPSGVGSYFDEITRRVSSRQAKQLGNELQPGRPLCVLFWLEEQGKLKPGLIPASLPDFVISQLCKSSPGVEVTNAAASGAFNLETMDWHHEVIKALGLDDLNWPPLRKQGDIIGCFRAGARLLPCHTPVGDYQCALVGALLDEEEISLNISTGSQISRQIPKLSFGDYQTRPFFDGEFLNTFTHVPGGRALDVLVDLLTELPPTGRTNHQDTWDFIGTAVGGVATTTLKVDLTFFPGPEGDRGSISNIRGDNLTTGHLFRAAFNDMADKHLACALRLWPDRSWKRIVFSGGVACKVEVLRHVIQERFGTVSRLAPFREDTLFGLLALASVFRGDTQSVREAVDNLRRCLEAPPALAGSQSRITC